MFSQDVFAKLDPDEMCEALEPGLLEVVSGVLCCTSKHSKNTLLYALSLAAKDTKI